MKVILLHICLLFSLPVFSQHDSTNNKKLLSIKFNLLNFLAKGVGITTEFGPIKQLSISGTFSSAYAVGIGVAPVPDRYRSFIADVKYYPFQKGNTKSRPYVGGYFRKANNEKHLYSFHGLTGWGLMVEEANVHTVAGGAMLGLQMFLGKNLVFDVFAGGGYTYYQSIKTVYLRPGFKNGIASELSNGFRDVRMGICLGVAL